MLRFGISSLARTMNFFFLPLFFNCVTSRNSGSDGDRLKLNSGLGCWRHLIQDDLLQEANMQRKSGRRKWSLIPRKPEINISPRFHVIHVV